MCVCVCPAGAMLDLERGRAGCMVARWPSVAMFSLKLDLESRARWPILQARSRESESRVERAHAGCMVARWPSVARSVHLLDDGIV